MTSLDLRVGALSLLGNPGTSRTLRLVFTADGEPVEPGPVSVWIGGDERSPSDFDGAVEHPAVVAGNEATVTVPIPAGRELLRVTIDSALATIGTVAPSLRGTADQDQTVQVHLGAVEVHVTSLVPGTDVDPVEIVTDPAAQAALSATFMPLVGGMEDIGVASTARMRAVAESAPSPLTTPTYDGSGQAVHPSVVRAPAGWGGYEWWMAMTPYPGAGSSAMENPSILASHDGITWVVPDGLTNPVEPKPGGSSGNFNSDPYLIFHDDHLYLFFRQVNIDLPGEAERIYYRRSANGVDWDDKVLVIAHDRDVRSVVSPCVDVRGGVWRMWAVNDPVSGPNEIWTWTASDPAGPWTGPEVVTGVAYSAGHEPWHIDVRRMGHEYVLGVHETSGGTTSGGGFYRRSVSADGVAFTSDPVPFMTGPVGAWDTGTYKFSLWPATVDGGQGYRCWYSAFTGDTGWRIGHTLVRLTPKEEASPAILAASVPVKPFLAGDLVDRPDDSSPGNLTSGQAWVEVVGSWSVASGALSASASGYLGFDVGRGDNIEVGFEVAIVPPSGVQMQVLACWDGLTNGDRIGWGPNGPSTMGKGLRIDSVNVDTGNYNRVAPAVGQRIRIRVEDGMATCFADDLMLWRVDVSALTSNTWVGVRRSGSGDPAAITNFYVKAL